MLKALLFFLFLNSCFNWRKIALQCCVGFCLTTMWISHNYTYIPFVLNLLPCPSSHLSESSQSTRLSSLCYTAASHQLSVWGFPGGSCGKESACSAGDPVNPWVGKIPFTHDSEYMSATFSIRPTLSLPHCARKSILYIWVSIPSLKIWSSIFLNSMKEWIWVSSSEVDEPRACFTEWSKSEREVL